MNNYIVGYLAGIRCSNSKSILDDIATSHGIGLKEILPGQLFQFPDEYLPNNRENNFIFSMSDSPDREEADYLIDYLDYAPEMQSKYPSQGRERLLILIKILQEMMINTKCSNLVISLTDSGYIYSHKNVKFSELSEVLLSDFEEEAPPDRLYNITF